MPSIQQAMPALALHCDEHTGKAGVTTRLEAFVDVLTRRRQEGLGPRR